MPVCKLQRGGGVGCDCSAVFVTYLQLRRQSSLSKAPLALGEPIIVQGTEQVQGFVMKQSEQRDIFFNTELV